MNAMTTKIPPKLVLADKPIMERIYTIRDQNVMLDRDLAMFYGYETKRMNEQVRRNIDRFPASFMFQLTQEEEEDLRSQIVTANVGSMARARPYAFTEHGLLMLAGVLKSEMATKMSVHLIEVFLKMRELVLTHKDILLKLEKIERQQALQDTGIKQLYQGIKLLTGERAKPRNPIGFQIQDSSKAKKLKEPTSAGTSEK